MEKGLAGLDEERPPLFVESLPAGEELLDPFVGEAGDHLPGKRPRFSRCPVGGGNATDVEHRRAGHHRQRERQHGA